MPAPIYAYNEITGIHSLWFRGAWPTTQLESTLLYKTTLGNFNLHFKKVEKLFLFSIKTDWADSTTLGKFKSCSVNNTNGCYVAFDEVSFRPEDKNLQHSKQNIDSKLKLPTKNCAILTRALNVYFCLSI